ncbi:DUF1178 family protein [Methylobacterium sp. E-005]|uniref:DUF1178 family protein n=1 Tax=Methylobacterium sp. E-005 TaxID=2836549 RepID=UPI001FB8D194|nr:DUF1178 family protein [Methylobacterium sp. E-005]MCJ2090625.1 DUF1178 family protein [Methylobacterium sp. E-005]
MIRYSLVCEAGHGFESWFPSSESFDTQAARGLVACPVCDSTSVSKALMVPSIARTDRGRIPAAPPVQTEAPVALIAEPERQVRAMLKALREHVVANAEHVGTRFPEEARKIHYGEAEGRSIYGEASPAEARALVEEGIEVAAIPILPDDRN